MFKLTVALVLAVAICVIAEPIRQKPLRKRVLFARQQLQPTAAPAGYPAAGVTPAVPFELPTETERPDAVYGPPEIVTESEAQQPDSVYGSPAAQTEQPDVVYGPPETDANPEINETTPEGAAKLEPSEEEESEETEDLDDVEDEVLVDEDGSIIAISTTFGQGNAVDKPARLLYQRFPQRRQSPKAVPARLTQAKVLKPSNFVYTARY